MNLTRLVLLVILFFQLVFGVMYAVRTPRWQAPDEPAHYNYVRLLAETHTFPILRQGDYNQAYLEEIKSEKFPPDMSVDSIRYESHQPPLYYILATPIYVLASALGLDVPLALRLLNVALALIVSLLAYRIFREVFPDSALLPLVGVGIIASLPMHIAMSAAINNDTLAEIVVAVVLLLAILRVQGKLEQRRFIILSGVAYGIALLTKTTIYSSALLLIAAEIGHQQIIGTKEKASPPPLAYVRTLVPLFGIALVISIAWFARNALTYGVTDLFGWARHDSVVAGQPTTASYIAQYGLRNVLFDFFAISFKSFWAQFGWMGVLVNDRIYTFFFVLTVAASFGAPLWVLRLGREHNMFSMETHWTWRVLALFLVLTLAALVYYNLKFVQPQGRYLFPGLIAIAAFWATGLYELLNARYARLLFALLYVTMLALDYVLLMWFIVPQLAR